MEKRGNKANSHSEFLFNKNILNSKCSQSQIIGSILLILLVIISAMIIMGFAIPFIRDNLSKGECLDVIGNIEIRNNPTYTCYDSNNDVMRVQIHIGDVEELINGFQINLESGGDSKTFDVFEDSTEIEMHAGGDVEIPGKNQERTYTISGINNMPDSVGVYPILKNDKTCEISDSSENIVGCL